MSGIKVSITPADSDRDVMLDIYSDGVTIIEYAATEDENGLIKRIAEIELDKHMIARLFWKISKYMLRYKFEEEK